MNARSHHLAPKAPVSEHFGHQCANVSAIFDTEARLGLAVNESSRGSRKMMMRAGVCGIVSKDQLVNRTLNGSRRKQQRHGIWPLPVRG